MADGGDVGAGRAAAAAAAEEGGGDAAGASEGVTIHYRIHGHGRTKVVLIPGLACGQAFWGPYVRALTAAGLTADEDDGDKIQQESAAGIQVCTFDNRGVGSSSVPKRKSDYSTSIMAKDAMAVMDHLKWTRAHICGHSMGGMIALKLAAMAPERVLSLTLISVTGGGFQCLPKMQWKSIAIGIRFLNARTLEQRIRVDLDTHYTQDYLDATVGDVQRRNVLFMEYVKNMEASGMQPKDGLAGHMHACWTHNIRDADVQRLRAARILIAVVHGKHDVIAQASHARKLARQLHPLARMVELPGGHLVTHQNTEQVLRILLDIISAASNLDPLHWSGNEVGKSAAADCDDKDFTLEQQQQLLQQKPVHNKLKTRNRIVACLFAVLILLWSLTWLL